MSLLQVDTIRSRSGSGCPTFDRGINVNSGIATLGTLNVASGIVTANSGIITYYGDARYLQNVGLAITAVPTDLIVAGILTVTQLDASVVRAGTSLTSFTGYINTLQSEDFSSNSAVVSGDVTANRYFGNGSNISGIVTSLVAGENIILSGSSGRVTISSDLTPAIESKWKINTSGPTGISTAINVSIGTEVATSKLTVQGNVRIIGVTTSTSGFSGNLTGNVTGNLSGGSVNCTSVTSSGPISGSAANITGSITANTVTASGTITASDVNSTSDQSLKTNVSSIENPLDKVDQLNGVSFQWKESGENAIGVIAQEVEKVFPEVVHVNDEGLKTVSYGNLVAVLIEAVKELRQEVKELKENK
jgi:hypothetical protein